MVQKTIHMHVHSFSYSTNISAAAPVILTNLAILVKMFWQKTFFRRKRKIAKSPEGTEHLWQCVARFATCSLIG